MYTIEQVANNLDMRGDDAGSIVLNAGDQLGPVRYDPGLARPYFDKGQIWVDVFAGYGEKRDNAGNLVLNATGQPIIERKVRPQRMVDRLNLGLPVLQVDNATVLPKEAWISLDSAVNSAVRKRLKLIADLSAAVPYGGFDAMSYSLLEREFITDPGQAMHDMDGISEGQNFQALNALQGLPLPITYSCFQMSERNLMTSRAAGRPMDTQRGEIAGFRVGELLENIGIGNTAGMTYGAAAAGSYTQTSKVWGLTNHPARITKTDLTASASFAPETFYNEVLAMRELAYTNNIYGPFVLYVSVAYDAKLDQVFKTTTGNFPTGTTCRKQVLGIDGITKIQRLDYLSGDVLILVQMESTTIQIVNGLEIVTVQYDTKGGAQKNFKVMCIKVPWIKSSYKSGTTTEVTGIVHGTTS